MAKTMTTQQVLEAIARERRRLDDAVRAMGPGASTVPLTAEGWTTKDVLGHCIHWASQIAFGLGAKLEPPDYVANAKDRPAVDEWNARAVRHYRSLSFDQVKAELDRVVDALIAQVRKKTDAEMSATDTLPYAAPEPLWQQIANETFEHWPEHADDIARATRGVA
jgi:uncharacterized protein (TIGR03083 family)